MNTPRPHSYQAGLIAMIDNAPTGEARFITEKEQAGVFALGEKGLVTYDYAEEQWQGRHVVVARRAA